MNLKTKVMAIVLGVLALFVVCMIPALGEDVKNEEIVVNQYPFTGEMAYWTTPGFKWQGCGNTTHYFKTMQVWFNEINESRDGDYNTFGLNNPALPITYADKGKGFVLGSVRIELPVDVPHLNLLQAHYGSEERLMTELIEPTIGKVILACGPLMTSLESVAERRNDLNALATDQLNNGIYATKLKTVERVNAITGEKEKVQQAEIDYDENGNPKRNEESPFAKYGLKVSQLAIADWKYEKATNDQIARQREADMDIITAKAEAAKAIQQTIKIEEEGKQKAALAKWEQEAIKAAAVTKAEQSYEVARLAALEAKEKAKKIKAEGEAEAAAARAKVNAGLTPQEKAEWQYKTAVGVAEALAKSNVRWVPEVMIGGQGSGKFNPLDAVGYNYLLETAQKMSKK